jgi:tRNA(fMet)-specific endonuclease VapC
MNRTILDTDTLSYILDRRHPEVVQTARQYLRVFRYFSISSVTVEEAISGYVGQRNVEGRSRFLSQLEAFEVIPFDREEAQIAGDIVGSLKREGQSIGTLDPFIAATAIVNDRELITNNLRHYARIVDLGFPLRLNNWRQE